MSRRFRILLTLSLLLFFATQGAVAQLFLASQAGAGQGQPPADIPSKSAPASEEKQPSKKPSDELEAASKQKKEKKIHKAKKSGSKGVKEAKKAAKKGEAK
ncbi:MAG TPA: hypothetical protein VEV41_07370 [Terriglobales bacterium]|nr:hypothetical protein [Terriglobales bacterium]